jgi:hypothetical protein
VRFRCTSSVNEQLAWALSIEPVDHLVLVKPMFLRTKDLEALRQRLNAQRVTIFLWDAIWRTPSITNLAGNAKVFSTEPADCETFGFTLLPVPSLDEHENFGSAKGPTNTAKGGSTPAIETSISERPIRLFFCGSWSVDRLLAARRLLAAIRSHQNTPSKQSVGATTGRQFACELHLVTTSWLAARLNRSVSANSSSLTNAEYEGCIESCDVLLDFGRAGQSSPSERLSAAAKSGKILLSTNVQLERLGFPVLAVTSRDWIDALAYCERKIRDNVAVRQAWETNPAARKFSITGKEWASSVLLKSTGQPSASPTESREENSERPFSFGDGMPKLLERIPV